MKSHHPLHRTSKPRVIKSRKTPRARRRYIWGIVSPILVVVVMAGFFWGVMMSAEAHGVKSAQSFVQDASVGNQFEISSSQLALQKSQNDNIRQFAQHMIDDHTKIGDSMTTTLSSMDNPPAPANALDAKHQHMLDKLNTTSGDNFDKQYMREQIAAHKEATSLFGDYAKHGDNDKLKAFASEVLPTIQNHEQEAANLNRSI